jgi:hypothetical protein
VAKRPLGSSEVCVLREGEEAMTLLMLAFAVVMLAIQIYHIRRAAHFRRELNQVLGLCRLMQYDQSPDVRRQAQMALEVWAINRQA